MGHWSANDGRTSESTRFSSSEAGRWHFLRQSPHSCVSSKLKSPQRMALRCLLSSLAQAASCHRRILAELRDSRCTVPTNPAFQVSSALLGCSSAMSNERPMFVSSKGTSRIFAPRALRTSIMQPYGFTSLALTSKVALIKDEARRAAANSGRTSWKHTTSTPRPRTVATRASRRASMQNSSNQTFQVKTFKRVESTRGADARAACHVGVSTAKGFDAINAKGRARGAFCRYMGHAPGEP
mmetsp:Transcript_136015/g.290777  ORF Transcript_136015/g.290777 Transcript_136015/m.290777 type:complete len:240 (+) Transcript_136015:453-1172(+)